MEDQRHEFSVLEAAVLWVEADPNDYKVLSTAEDSVRVYRPDQAEWTERDQRVSKMFMEIMLAAKHDQIELIVPKGTMEWSTKHDKVTKEWKMWDRAKGYRDEFIRWARTRNEKPKFLFPDARLSSPQNVRTSPRTQDDSYRQMGLSWNEVTLILLPNLLAQIIVRDIDKRIYWSDLGLVDRRSGNPNRLAEILLMMSVREHLSASDAVKRVISRLRNCLQYYFGIDTDPFVKEQYGWTPQFNLINRIVGSVSSTTLVPFDENRHHPESECAFEDEDDETADWLHENDPDR